MTLPPTRSRGPRYPPASLLPSGKMEVRPVRPDEYRRAGELVVAAYRALPGGRLSSAYEHELRDVPRRAAEADVLVAAAGGGLVGCVTFVADAANPWAEQLQEDEASIRMLGVHPVAQRQGAGRALLETAILRAQELGRGGLFLHSTPWMASAHRLYGQVGFVRSPERDWLPVPDVALLAFRLDLRGWSTRA
jgi:GNAT superfamily N-acetyltransferase